MENEDILKKMVADEMVLTVVDPTDYSEVACYIEGGNGDYSLISNDTQGFNLPIRRLIVQGSQEFYILCGGVDDYFEVIDIN